MQARETPRISGYLCSVMATTGNLVAFCVLCIVGFPIQEARGVSLVKRRLEQFADMISITTGREPHHFNNYGGWCGRGGDGTPVDDIDRCCMIHDLCYRRVWRNECKTFFYLQAPYLTYYEYETNEGNITCTNDPETELCERTVCECDREAAKCFGQHHHKYDDEHKSNSKVTQILDKTIQKLLATPDKLNQWKDIFKNNIPWDVLFG
ncbi:acidic phospholipase A2 Cc1-PLA2-like [Tubulanus polymorphus]|uniref:acidic phospholipase A2 Cc1-PLA2-like n=1 Tax=Tubulanus polymorphus TaxID=672921 RepID=UPI003DA439D5